MEFLRFASIANLEGPDDRCGPCAEWLVRYLNDRGFSARSEVITGKPNVLAEMPAANSDCVPTLLVYGHYDVQPSEPLDEWKNPPFDPVVRDGRIHARGASDDKGPVLACIAAAQAWAEAGGPPVNLKFLIEGSEEIGSPNLEGFVEKFRDDLRSDAALVVDTDFFSPDLPSITCGLRGLAYFEIEVTGPSADLHSGLHGGAVKNPINALAKIIAAFHDDSGRVMIDGFYDDVLAVDELQRQRWLKLPFDEQKYAELLGVDALTGGEKGFDALERIWARPTLDCNGITGGYTAAGSKTIIPASASAKISCRLVPDQDPDKITAALKKFVRRQCPPGVKVSVKINATARPVLIDVDSPIVAAASEAINEIFAKTPAMIRCGASVPAVEILTRILKIPTVPIGVRQSDDNVHSPNEKYDLDMFIGVAKAAALIMQKFASGRQST